MKAGAVSFGLGDVEKIEVPDAAQFDRFVEVGTVRGSKERATITLTGRYARDLKSELLRLANRECQLDVQINFGACTDPTDYNTFEKKIVLESANLTNWETEDLGALGSDERDKVDESVEVSARDVYEIVPVSFTEKAGDVITNELVDVVICDQASCGDCDVESTGCQRIYAISLAAGGSPSTPPDLVYSLDEGVTWYAHDIDTMTNSEDPDGVHCLGANLFVISEDTESLHYVAKSSITTTADPAFAEVSTGFASGGGPRAVDVGQSKAFIVGAGGYIYSTEDITTGVTVLDAGTLYTDSYNDVSALSDSFAVAVGDNGRIVKTENGTSWATVTPSPVGVGVHLNAVLVRSKLAWLIGTAGGQLYYTVDGGTTWTEKLFPGSGSGQVRDIVKANDTVLYMAHDTTAPLGRVLRSSNGGYDWVVAPEGVGTLPASDRINALAACGDDPDMVVGVGLGDNASDGFLILGS
jgi:photosystem II stability/assembly factor-like uncharacterized protein